MNSCRSKYMFWCFIFIMTIALNKVTLASDYGAIVHMKNSLYTSVFVYKSGSVMTLKFGRKNSEGAQSQVDLENLDFHLSEYTEMAFSGLFYNSDPNNVLVLGLGGGVIPREMRKYYPESKIDIVEIDQEILPVATKYFMFQPDANMKVHIADGRMYVKKHNRRKEAVKYEYIVLDAFNSEYIPFHLMTREFLLELKEILADDGVIVANVWYPNDLFDAEFKTFNEVFGKCQVYCGDGNAMIVAVGSEKSPLTLQQAIANAVELGKKHKFSFDITQVANLLVPNAMPHPQAIILTDDRAPVNQLRERNSFAR